MIKFLVLFGAISQVRNDVISENCIPVSEFWSKNKRNFSETEFYDILIPGNMLGNGSQGDVYKTKLNDFPIAVKRSSLKEEIVAELFEREVLNYKTLDKFENKPTVYACLYTRGSKGIIDNGYFVMNMAGISVLNANSPIFYASPEKKLKGFIEIADVFSEFNKFGLIHFDIRPENLLYDIHKKVYIIIDFGMSCRTGESNLAVNLMTNPPEQNRIWKSGKCTLETDLWQYFILVAKLSMPGNMYLLHEGMNVETCFEEELSQDCVEKLHDNIRKYTSRFPKEFTDILIKGLSYDRVSRFKSFVEISDRLRKIEATPSKSGNGYNNAVNIPVDVIMKHRTAEKNDGVLRQADQTANPPLKSPEYRPLRLIVEKDQTSKNKRLKVYGNFGENPTPKNKMESLNNRFAQAFRLPSLHRLPQIQGANGRVPSLGDFNKGEQPVQGRNEIAVANKENNPQYPQKYAGNNAARNKKPALQPLNSQEKPYKEGNKAWPNDAKLNQLNSYSENNKYIQGPQQQNFAAQNAKQPRGRLNSFE